MSASHALNVLGPLQLVVGGEVVALPPMQRRLVAILSMEPTHELDMDTLVARLWGNEPPATARTAAQVHISTLRKAAPELLVTTAAGYRLVLDGFSSDQADFEAAAQLTAESAAVSAWDALLSHAREAIDLWRGTPFPDLAGDDQTLGEVDRLAELREAVEQLRAEALIALDRHGDAIPLLKALVHASPLREPAWTQLMRALHGSGRGAEALRAFEDARQIIGSELGVEPGPAMQELADQIRFGGDPHSGPQQPQAAHRLPDALTSFVGRERDIQKVARMLKQSRSVTIVGGPGVGKTRLAMEAGRLLAERFPGGVWFVPLAGAQSARDVTSIIATSTETRFHAADLDELASRLARRPALLILDNCEHQPDPTAQFLHTATRGHGQLRVLATSRSPIESAGGRQVSVEPLVIPGPNRDQPERQHPLASAAMRLFVDRARHSDRGFRVTAETAPIIADLCRGTAGIPLVIELAASWVHALGLAEIRQMLGAGLAAPSRRPSHLMQHDSLHAAIDWSTSLIPAADRELLEAMSVFGGTFGLQDVRAVCAPDEDRRQVAAAIARVVDASLLTVERRPGGRAVYRMLVPIRDYFRDRLAKHAEQDAVTQRFTSHYLRRAESLRDDPHVGVTDLSQIDDEIDNMRAAFEVGLAQGRGDEVARALVPLNGYFFNRYLAWEGRGWLTRTLEQVRDRHARAHVLRARSSLAQVTNDLDAAASDAAAALWAFRSLKDRTGMEMCLIGISILHGVRGEWEAGIRSAKRGRALVGRNGSPSALGSAASYLGDNLVSSGRFREGVVELERAARYFQRSGELGRAAHALSTLTHVAVQNGVEPLARRHAPVAIDLARRSGSSYRLARALGAAAATEARWGNPDGARRLLLEAHPLAGPNEVDTAYDFIFPLLFLLRAWGRWNVLGEALRVAERAIAANGQAYPVSWQRIAAEWKQEMRALGRPDDAHPSRRRGTQTTDELLVRILPLLEAVGGSALAEDGLDN